MAGLIDWSAKWIAEACTGRLVRDRSEGAGGFAIDSRETGEGDLFVGIPGERSDGGSFAAEVARGGAWGVLVTEAHVASLDGLGCAVIEHPDPVRALGLVAAAHRERLDCKVIGVTGSSGKTSTKDILATLLAKAGPTVATRGNRNSEIGLPLELLRADRSTAFLVLEMAMRGEGQIAELTSIARPDVGVIVSIGTAPLELLGSIERIAAAKSELIAGLSPGAVAVVPADEPLLRPHLRSDLTTVTFGDGGDWQLEAADERDLSISAGEEEFTISVDFDQPHNHRNLLAALAACEAVGVRPPRDLQVEFSSHRGERIAIDGGILVINDCYNANPDSMAAGLDDLGTEVARRGGRSVAVLGDMLELGPDEERFHRDIGGLAAKAGVELLVTVGPLAAGMTTGFGGSTESFPDSEQAAVAIRDLLESGDTVLVKGSRGVRLDLLVDSLRSGD